MPIRILDRNSAEIETAELRFLFEMEKALLGITGLSLQSVEECTLASVISTSVTSEIAEEENPDLLAVVQKVLEMNQAIHASCLRTAQSVKLVNCVLDLLHAKFPHRH